MEDVIHWITEHKEESFPNRKVSHSHSDPTANEAIGNVLWEERRKKQRPRKRPKRERAFITGDGVGKPLGLLAETGGAKVGVTAAQKDAVSFDEIFKLYYALKAPYRKKAQFLCNEALVLQLMTIKDNNGNYIWKPGLEIGKPDILLNRPLKTSAFMPEIKGGSKVMAFGDYSYYWVADRQNRTFRRQNELYARIDQVGFLTTQRVDGKAKTGTNTTDDVYNKWYDAVYEPQAEAVDTEDTSHTEEPQG
ncbi:MAG: phage major capsid protein [Clostridium sp.]|nr:phage major capsid protein [Clostridium sp.]